MSDGRVTRGVIGWFAENGVAANLLMLVILGAGAATLAGIKQEVFPEFSSDIVSVRVPPCLYARRHGGRLVLDLRRVSRNYRWPATTPACREARKHRESKRIRRSR